MREIKFRAKHYDEWYYGNLTTRKAIDEKGNVHVVYILTGFNVEKEMWLPLHEEQYDTIGQYTGMHDCKGNEIYEGDIIEGVMSNGDKIYHVVRYDDKNTGFVLYSKDDPQCECGHLNQHWLNECQKTVVGNVFDGQDVLL